jgi:hypothetical protein
MSQPVTFSHVSRNPINLAAQSPVDVGMARLILAVETVRRLTEGLIEETAAPFAELYQDLIGYSWSTGQALTMLQSHLSHEGGVLLQKERVSCGFLDDYESETAEEGNATPTSSTAVALAAPEPSVVVVATVQDDTLSHAFDAELLQLLGSLQNVQDRACNLLDIGEDGMVRKDFPWSECERDLTAAIWFASTCGDMLEAFMSPRALQLQRLDEEESKWTALPAEEYTARMEERYMGLRASR